MTAHVPIWAPEAPAAGSLYIAEPDTGLLNAGLVDCAAHLLGAQLTQVAFQIFGKQELPLAAGTVRYYYRARASTNARAWIVSITPYGYTAGTFGTIKVSGAEVLETQTVRQNGGAIVNLDELQVHSTLWVLPVTTANGENVIEIECVDCRLHAVTIWEAPRAFLTGTHEHVDRSFADTSRYITDDEVASNPRGVKALLNAIAAARRQMRRHVANWAWPTAGVAIGDGGLTFENGAAFAYRLGSAAASDGVRCYSRDVGGSGVTTTPCLCRVYVSGVSVGSTHTIRLINDVGTTFDIAGINAAGWWPAPAGAALAVTLAAGTDHLKIQTQRTAGGAGDVGHLNSVSVWEALS